MKFTGRCNSISTILVPKLSGRNPDARFVMLYNLNGVIWSIYSFVGIKYYIIQMLNNGGISLVDKSFSLLEYIHVIIQ